jgi:hypothetical protein
LGSCRYPLKDMRCPRISPLTSRISRTACRLLAAAAETLHLWDGELSYPDLAEDIAAEARLALAISAEIRDLERKIAALLHQLDPAAIMTSAPRVGVINGAQILARLGDPARFQSLAGGSPPLAAGWTASPPPTTAPPSPCRQQWRSIGPDSGNQEHFRHPAAVTHMRRNSLMKARSRQLESLGSASAFIKRNRPRIVGETGPVF